MLLKFGGRERLGGMLGGLLARLWNSDEELQAISDSVIVPVPLDRSRERERGFNQATLLVRGLSGRLRKDGAGLGIRVSLGCLIRTRATVPQTGLSLPARLENVRGAFAVESENQIRGRVAVVVDDVMTTGATLSACAGALKRAGAVRAIGLTLARSTPQFPDVPGPNRPVDEAARKSA